MLKNASCLFRTHSITPNRVCCTLLEVFYFENLTSIRVFCTRSTLMMSTNHWMRLTSSSSSFHNFVWLLLLFSMYKFPSWSANHMHCTILNSCIIKINWSHTNLAIGTICKLKIKTKTNGIPNQIKKCYQRCGLTELNCHIAPVIIITQHTCDGGAKF